MKMGRQPSSPTRVTAYTHASLFILVNMSLASFSSFSEGFLGGMGQNALRVALPETRIIFSVYFPESRTPSPQLPGVGPTPFSRSRLPRPRAFSAHPSRRRRLRLQTAQLPPPAWGAQKSEGGGMKGGTFFPSLSAS